MRLLNFVLIGLSFAPAFATPAAAEECQAKPTCEDLKYDKVKTACNGKYFVCPLDKNKVKCDETAKVGDIKYSKSSTPGDGWLYCDGSVYDEVKYPELYSLIGTGFGGSASAPKLPDYRGVYLRGAGTVYVRSGYKGTTNLYELQPSSIVTHKHKYSFYNYYWISPKNGGNIKYSDYMTTANWLTEVVFDNAGDDETCPVSIGLYPYIYVGEAK